MCKQAKDLAARLKKYWSIELFIFGSSMYDWLIGWLIMYAKILYGGMV